MDIFRSTGSPTVLAGMANGSGRKPVDPLRASDAKPLAFHQALMQRLLGAHSMDAGAMSQELLKLLSSAGQDAALADLLTDLSLPQPNDARLQAAEQGSGEITSDELAQMIAQFAQQIAAADVNSEGGRSRGGDSDADDPPDPAAISGPEAGATPTEWPVNLAIPNDSADQSAVPKLGDSSSAAHPAVKLTLPAATAKQQETMSLSTIDNEAQGQLPEIADFRGVQTDVKTIAPAMEIGPAVALPQGIKANPEPTQALSSKDSTPVLDEPLGHPAWQQELGERLLWMTHRSLHSAELRLNPPHLGPLEIHIALNQDQAIIQFSSQHAAVREAIEAAIPKLREMLGTQQVNLVDVNVSQQSWSQQKESRENDPHCNQGAGSQYGEAYIGPPDHEERTAVDETLLSIAAGKGLLNMYA